MLHIFFLVFFFNIKDSPGVNIVEDESNTKVKVKVMLLFTKKIVRNHVILKLKLHEKKNISCV